LALCLISSSPWVLAAEAVAVGLMKNQSEYQPNL